MSPRILVVDDEAEICRLLNEILRDEGYAVDIAQNAQQARQLYGSGDYSLVLLDIWMPDADGITLLREWSSHQLTCPVVMMSGHGTIEAAVEATRLGAFDFIEKPLSLSKLLQVVKQALASGRQSQKAPTLLSHQPTVPSGKSRVMQQLREQLQRAAGNTASTLLLGEAGSGRETCARFLHANSTRAQFPLVVMTPASINDDTAALELFGNVATKTVGLLSRARGGTLLIKAVEDASPVLQKLLLGVFESKSFTPIGSTQSEPLDVRLICTAQPGFPSRVGQQGFRADLFIHLNTFTIQIPALRDRAEDVPELLRYYTERIADEEHLPLRRFDVSAQNRLRNYPWPGNVQELRNLVRRLLMTGGTEEIHLEEIELELNAQASEHEPLVKHDLLALPLREAREHFERAYLQQQLMLCEGKVGQLAKRVGMERTHLYRKLRMLGVDIKQLADE
ncbi:MAG TPA: sigma-54 dependent transcriptional regulator [Steroidobacteraceae bacterium]|nr:sigma-54 dependent transcriptional regulator [Steroidobacteraceae bacterium]